VRARPSPLLPARLVPAALALALVLLTGCSPTTTTATLGAADDTADLAAGWNGVAVDGTPALPAATFTDTDGEPFDLRAAAADRATLVYFGYTHCPDICPVHLANIAAALERSPVRAEQLNVVLVTVDPERDTVAVLDDFVHRFDRSFVALRAPRAEVDRVVTALGLPAPVIEGDPASDDYTVGHPPQVLAFDRRGRARLAYPFGTRQSQWVEDLPKLVRDDPPWSAAAVASGAG
jgi:protein SCO1/2